jgi:hypothetical protein
LASDRAFKRTAFSLDRRGGNTPPAHHLTLHLNLAGEVFLGCRAVLLIEPRRLAQDEVVATSERKRDDLSHLEGDFTSMVV